MAQYSVKHTCGHIETVQIYGTNVHGERERRAEWMEGKPCQECVRAAELAAAQQQAAEQHLPALTGSEKQIAWAERIRAQKLAEMREFVEQLRGAPTHTDAEELLRVRALSAIERAIAQIAAQTSAGWWIDRRDTSRRQLLDPVTTAIVVEDRAAREAAKEAAR